MLIENPWTQLRELTAARIALGRAGHSLPTRELLAFQLAHAKARDAVWCDLDLESLDFGTPARSAPLFLRSSAHDRATYLRRPDLGRVLGQESAATIELGEWDAVIVIADGLSATAVHRHAGVLVSELLGLLSERTDRASTEVSTQQAHPERTQTARVPGRLAPPTDLRRAPQGAESDGWRIAPVCVVEQGRVAIGDEIGERIGASMALVLLGERPGLSSPDSLGAYLTWAPRVGRTDAERNCVSNIRSAGLDPKIAAVRIGQLMNAARARQLTGVGLSAGRVLT
jgi:ethanolamine ammonia-lyase small subunit